jgi:hypothetical protein
VLVADCLFLVSPSIAQAGLSPYLPLCNLHLLHIILGSNIMS